MITGAVTEFSLHFGPSHLRFQQLCTPLRSWRARLRGVSVGRASGATQGVDSAKGVEMAHFTVLYQQAAGEMDVAVDYERYIALDQVINDSPCLPCTSHGASITQPLCVACHPTTAAHGGAWWRRRRGRTEPEGGGVLFTLPAAAGGKLLRPRSQLAQIALRQRVFCPRRGVWRPPGCCRDKNRG
jgi:hypothetical protein